MTLPPSKCYEWSHEVFRFQRKQVCMQILCFHVSVSTLPLGLKRTFNQICYFHHGWFYVWLVIFLFVWVFLVLGFFPRKITKQAFLFMCYLKVPWPLDIKIKLSPNPGYFLSWIYSYSSWKRRHLMKTFTLTHGVNFMCWLHTFLVIFFFLCAFFTFNILSFHLFILCTVEIR